MSENTILMEEKSLGYLLHNHRIVIPEIQREYVWGDVTIGRNVLGHFFKDFLGDFADYKQWMNDIDKTVNTLRTKIEKVSGALPLDEKFFRESAENQLSALFRSEIFIFRRFPIQFQRIDPDR